MVSEEKSKKITLSVFLSFGVICGIVVFSILGASVQNKWSYYGVQSLRCSYQKIDFTEMMVMSNATGQNFVWLYIYFENETLPRHLCIPESVINGIVTLNIVDVGIVKWENEEFLAISTEKVLNDGEYIVEHGYFADFYEYARYDKIKILILDEIREPDWFDNLFSEHFLQMSLLMVFLISTVISFIAVPLIELLGLYNVFRKIAG